MPFVRQGDVVKIEIINKDEKLLPFKELMRSIDGASENDVKVLVLLCAYADGRIVDTDECKEGISETLGLDSGEFESAVAFWRGAKVLKMSKGTKKTEVIKLDTKNCTKLEDKLPEYTQGEMADKISQIKDLKDVIDECQQILGKIFSPSDVSVIVGMADRLALSGEYIIMFVAYCAGMEKKSLRYIEKSVCAIYDEGIDTPDKLAAYIENKEKCHEESVKVRRMMGCADRDLSPKESALLKKWLEEYSYEFEIIKRAYDIAADRGIKGSFFPYMGAILDAWYNKGYKTAKDVDEMLDQYKKSKNESGRGFDTDDFFSKAVEKTKRKRNAKNTEEK